jgi:hypothetical protein
LQLADAAGWNRSSLIVHHSELVAGYGGAGRPVTHFTRAVGEEDMQHLRGSDAVEDVDAKASGPTLAYIPR